MNFITHQSSGVSLKDYTIIHQADVQYTNIAHLGTAEQISTHARGEAFRCIDGNTDGAWKDADTLVYRNMKIAKAIINFSDKKKNCGLIARSQADARFSLFKFQRSFFDIIGQLLDAIKPQILKI